MARCLINILDQFATHDKLRDKASMFFLVFEGLDGSGKSTLIKKLQDFLVDSNNESVLVTREPGGTEVGDEIRQIILKKRVSPHSTLESTLVDPTPRAELLLYQASRAQHVECVIKPALAEKKWVLCDRFTASSVAFQGGGRGISDDHIQWLNSFSTFDLKPDLTILLDLTVDESKKRQLNRTATSGQSQDRIEAEADSFHEKVRQSFLKQANSQANSQNSNQSSWLVLDASESVDSLFQKLKNQLINNCWIKTETLK